MYVPAADSPNHVKAYPAWTAGVTLNSPTLEAAGWTGHLNGALSYVPSLLSPSSSLTAANRGSSVRTCGEPRPPTTASMAGQSNQYSLAGRSLRLCSATKNLGTGISDERIDNRI